METPEREKSETKDPEQASAESRLSSPELEPLTASEEARRLALAIAGAGLDKKASGIEIIDVIGKVDYAEILVLMTGRSERHVAAIASGIQEDLKREKKTAPLSVEGLTAAKWVLIDYNDVVVHVFQQDARLYYDLEGLWIDAGRIAVPSPTGRVDE
ncbi:MAG: ribosome silencing factor [Myxococcota bacterium]